MQNTMVVGMVAGGKMNKKLRVRGKNEKGERKSGLP